jgi:hypothetical protein
VNPTDKRIVNEMRQWQRNLTGRGVSNSAGSVSIGSGNSARAPSGRGLIPLPQIVKITSTSELGGGFYEAKFITISADADAGVEVSDDAHADDLVDSDATDDNDAIILLNLDEIDVEGTASQLAEDLLKLAHPSPWWTNEDPPRPIWTVQSGGGGGNVNYRVKNVGGTAGGNGALCSFTYDVYAWQSVWNPSSPGADPIATAVTLVGNGNRVAPWSMTAGTVGGGFFDGATFILTWVDETAAGYKDCPDPPV